MNDSTSLSRRRSVLASVAIGLLLASTAALVVAWFHDWGTSDGASWLGSTGWLVVLTAVQALLLLATAAEAIDRTRRHWVLVAGIIPLLLGLACVWAVATGAAPYPAQTRWPLVVCAAGVGIVATVLIRWSARMAEPATKRTPIILLVGALGTGLIWLPAGGWRHAINIDATTTDQALSPAVEGPFRVCDTNVGDLSLPWWFDSLVVLMTTR